MDVGLSELDIMQPDHAAVATTAKSKHDSNQIQSQVKVLPILRLAFTFQVKGAMLFSYSGSLNHLKSKRLLFKLKDIF